MRRLESILAGLALAGGLSACQNPTPREQAVEPIAQVSSSTLAPVGSAVAFTTLYESETSLSSDCLRERDYSPESFGIVVKDAQSLGDLYAKLNFGFITDEAGEFQKCLPEYQPNFSEEMVIGVFQGQRPATTYGITINCLVETPNELIVVSTLKEHMNNLPYFDLCMEMSPGQLIVCSYSDKPVSFIWNKVDPRAEEFQDPANTYMLSMTEEGIQALLDAKPEIKDAMAAFEQSVNEDCMSVGTHIEYEDAFIGVARLEREQIVQLQKKGYVIEKAFPDMR